MGFTQECLIGLDIGTSMIKGVLMSVGGSVIAREKDATEYFTSQDGWVEFDAEIFFKRAAGVIRKLVTALPKRASVAGFSMASASGNTLLTDGSGKPMLSAFSWLDTRVNDEIGRVFGPLSKEEVHGVVGWPLNNKFPLAHLAWLKVHRPELLKKAARVCMSTDYINYRLTGEWGIDSSTATTFYLQEQTAARWHAPFLENLEIPVEKLPPIYTSGTVLGTITPDASMETGLPTGTPVILGAFDHPCAARGAGVLEEGQILISCGTSWVGFYPVRERRKIVKQGMLADPFLQPDGPWGAMFSLSAIANKVDGHIRKYISDNSDRYRAFDYLAASDKPGAGGLLFNPALHSEPLSLGSYTEADIARALMEGTAYLFKMRIEELEKEGISALSAVMVGGPSETHPWPEIVCDVLGIPVSTVNGSCAGAVGAAILAGIGVGIYTSAKDAFKKTGFIKLLRDPDKNIQKLYHELYLDFKQNQVAKIS